MTRDELIEFIGDNMYVSTPDKIKSEMGKDIRKLDVPAFIRKWGDTLEEYTEGWSDIVEKSKPIPEQIREAFGSSDEKNPFKRPDNYVNEIFEKKFKDIVSREQFDKELKTQSDYWDYYKKERELQAARAKREKEVKEDWTPLTKNPNVSGLTGLIRWLLGSEYEKQRYINEPEKAILGEQAETTADNFFNKGDAISDIAFGAAGAVGDMIPIGSILAGPAARAARDIYHKSSIFDEASPYQKSWGEIAADAGADALVNVGVDLLPNFRQYIRGLNFFKGIPSVKRVSDAMQLEDDVKAILNPDATALATNIEASAGFIPVYVNGKKVGTRPEMPKNSEIKKIVEGMPESPMKQDMLPLVADPQSIDTDVIREKIKTWQSNASQFYKSPEEKAAVKKDVDDPNSFLVSVGAMNTKNPLFSRIYLAEPLSVTEKAAKGALRGLETFLTYEGGSRFLKGSATASGRGKTPEGSEQEWYLRNLSRDWDMNFKPDKADRKDGSPKWEAYKQWHYNKFGTYPEED